MKALGIENFLIDTLSELVQINSVNPSLLHGPGEKEIVKFMADRLAELKLDPQIHTAAPGRYNLVALIPGMNRGQSLLLNGHLDTVGIQAMSDPFLLVREGDRLYGRGAFDMKGSLAIMLLLAENFSRHPPPIDIFLTFVADEEDKSVGMQYLADNWLPDISPPPVGGIFLEPTDELIGVCHKGFKWYQLDVEGRAAHGSKPEEGIDAILPLRAALDALHRIQDGLLRREPDQLLGHATLHSSIIAGGTELSVIPSRAYLQWERRTLPAESQDELDRELQRIVRAVENHPGNHTVKGRELFSRPPYRVPGGSEIVDRLQKATGQSGTVGFPYWADTALAGQAGIPSILFGPVGRGAHAVDEWVSLKSLVRVYEILKRLIMDF